MPLLRHQLPKDYTAHRRIQTPQEHYKLINSTSFRNHRTKNILFSTPGPDEDSVFVKIPQSGTRTLQTFIFDREFFNKTLSRFSATWAPPDPRRCPIVSIKISVQIEGVGQKTFNARNLVRPDLFGEDIQFKNGNVFDYRFMNLS